MSLFKKKSKHVETKPEFYCTQCGNPLRYIGKPKDKHLFLMLRKICLGLSKVRFVTFNVISVRYTMSRSCIKEQSTLIR